MRNDHLIRLFAVANVFACNEHVYRNMAETGSNIRAKPRETRLMDCPSNRTSPRRFTNRVERTLENFAVV